MVNHEQICRRRASLMQACTAQCPLLDVKCIPQQADCMERMQMLKPWLSNLKMSISCGALYT